MIIFINMITIKTNKIKQYITKCIKKINKFKNKLTKALLHAIYQIPIYFKIIKKNK